MPRDSRPVYAPAPAVHADPQRPKGQDQGVHVQGYPQGYRQGYPQGFLQHNSPGSPHGQPMPQTYLRKNIEGAGQSPLIEPPEHPGLGDGALQDMRGPEAGRMLTRQALGHSHEAGREARLRAVCAAKALQPFIKDVFARVSIPDPSRPGGFRPISADGLHAACNLFNAEVPWSPKL